ncbi:alpha-galactosidase [Thelephora terrestris]|uniref:Alpha-galactosidase n=1 Tax=Thelephora terrestris TaxID=56493 RepID=A0A9P6H6Z2_9AGAM|nr:alpha-galactosidase [Thelephora terrestris]
MKPVFDWLSLLLLIPGVVVGYNNGLARTPQMGWNTWNRFGCDIDEELIVESAKVVAGRLAVYGYQYVVMDDCWHDVSRHPDTGAPRPDPERFPRGIKAVSDEVHALGLKIGIYSSAGMYTCAGRFGSLGYEEIDAKTYAEWGIDYLKYDNCFNEGQSGTPLLSFNRYAMMSRALNATGRPILYSMCNWGEDQPWNFATTIANSWRMSGDISDRFNDFDERCPCTSMLDCKLPGFHCSMARIVDFAAPLGQKAGPGQWNDLDMLQIGNGGMTFDEYVTHFSMWALLKSPLILGNDLLNMSNETWTVITNTAIIAVNQDLNGQPGIRLWKTLVPEGGDLQLWRSELVNSSFAVALMNASPEEHVIDVSFTDAFRDMDKYWWEATYTVYDLWEKDGEGEWGRSLGTMSGGIRGVTVASHQTKVWRLVPVSQPQRKRGKHAHCYLPRL